MLTTMANTTDSCQVTEKHIIELPVCCPISKNPRPGSTIEVSYEPRGKSLEVKSLVRYIHSFKGGLHDEYGNLIIRDMEGMLCRIAQDCAVQLGVEVRIYAQLEIVPRQGIEIVVKGGCRDE